MSMGKTRKTNKHLPRRMYHKHGGFHYVDRKNKWHSLGADYSDALKKYATFHERASGETIGALITSYEVEVLPKQAPDTIIARKKEFVNVRLVFGDMAPADLEASDAWKFFQDRGANRTARKEVSALSAVLSWARRMGIGGVKENPLFKIGFPTSKPRDRYVTDDEFTAVRDCASPMVRYAMNISLITGARQKDILRLDRKQVAAGVLHVRQSKTGKKIDYPVAGSLEENIDAALRMSPQVRQFVIVNREGKPYTRDGFQTQWKRAMTKAFPNKADRFTFHDIRAKSLSDADTTEQARVRAGHADITITEEVYRRKPAVASVMDISHLKGKKY
jgi:integrase